MPNNKLMLPRAQSTMLAAKARVIFEKEMSKGCLPEISPAPVELEPPYLPLLAPEDLLCADEQPAFIPTTPPCRQDLVRLKIWWHPEQECDWIRNELFVKQLHAITHRLTFEITGNKNQILFTLLCHKEDEPVVHAALRGFFPDCELSSCPGHPLDTYPVDAWETGLFESFYTPPPYSHLLTRPSELKLSPFESFLNSLSFLAPPSLGVYQVVIQPVALNHDWHHNVELLIDLEFLMRLSHSSGSLLSQQRYAQQAPSGQLNNMASEVETKSHADKPFFCAAIRVGLLGCPDGGAFNTLRALCTFLQLFQHGGRPMNCLSHDDYLRHISPNQVRDMFRLGTAHCAGSILNSFEVSGLLNIPNLHSFIARGLDIAIVDSYARRSELTSSGTLIGFTTRADQVDEVRWPDDIRPSHGHIIGRPRGGKSFLMEHMCCEDIENGHGVAIIDPHGDLSMAIMRRITEAQLERVVYLNPGDRTHVPMWNPMRTNQPADRIADDLVRAFMHITTGWGHRLETLLRHAIYGLIETGQGTLGEISKLLAIKSEERERIRKQIVDSVTNEHIRYFFEHKLPRYRDNDFSPVDHKLAKLMSHDTVALMFSQMDSNIDLREIMDTGKIFIVNLSTVGSDSRDILGGLLLSLVHMAALSRSELPPGERRAFHVYVDEAHRCVTSALEDMIAETRKYGVSLTLAHQYLSQFEKKQVDALGMVGTTIAFNVAADDAPRIAKFLRGQVAAEDLTSLEPREAIVRIGNDVMKIETPFMDEVTDTSVSDRAKQLSYERYYKPINEVLEANRRRGMPSRKHVAAKPSHPPGRNRSVEFHYEEFPSPKKT